MSNSKSKYPVIVGLFISIGIVILILLILTLGSQRFTFVEKIEIKAAFTDIGGLKVGDNVWLLGVKVGTIKTIDFAGDTAVLVTMNIAKKAEPFIHRNSKVKLSSDGLMGNRIIVIYGGDKATPLWEEHDILLTEKSTDTKDMLTTLDASNKNLLAITNNLKEISNKILLGRGMIPTLLNDSTLPPTIKHTLLELKTTIAHFKSSAAKVEKITSNIDTFSSNFNQKGTSINQLLMDTLVFNNLSASVIQLKATMNNISIFATNIKETSDALQGNNNSISVLLHDEQTATKLKHMIHHLDSASYKLDQDLEALQHNFLFKGYFKRKTKQ